MKTELRSSLATAAIVASSLLLFAACGKEEEPAPPPPEPVATPEMVEKVEELENEIRQIEEEEGQAAACEVVEEAQEMIFTATEVAWLHRNPGSELRAAYRKAVADGTPMRDVFDFEAGEGDLPKRYEEWERYDRNMVELRERMTETVSGERCARSLDEICEISQTNPHGFALVSETLEGLSGEMSCGG